MWETRWLSLWLAGAPEARLRAGALRSGALIGAPSSLRPSSRSGIRAIIPVPAARLPLVR